MPPWAATGVAAGWENLGDAGGFQTGGTHSERGPQAGPTSTDDHNVIRVVHHVIGP